MPIYRDKVEKPFCLVPMEIARDTSLSLKELGLMTKLYAFREDWNFTIAGLAKTMRCGVSQIRGTFDGLVGKGYIEVIRVRGPDGRFERTDLRLHRNPSERTGSPSSDFPHMEKPQSDIPHTGKQQEGYSPVEKRRESNNKESNNNESIMKEFSMKRSMGSTPQRSRRKNSFNNFEQRDYDYTKLERELLQAQDRAFLAEKEQEETIVSKNGDAGQTDVETSAAAVVQTGEVMKGA